MLRWGGRDGDFLYRSAPFFVSVPGWLGFGTGLLAGAKQRCSQLGDGMPYPKTWWDCLPHPLGHLVPMGAVGQCEMEAVIESKMNNSFGAIAHAPFGLILNPFVLLCPVPQPCFMASLRGQCAMHHCAGEEVGGKVGAGIAGRPAKSFKTLDGHAGQISLVVLEKDY